MYCVSRVTLEKRSSNAAPIVATRQEVLLDPRVEGVLYGWFYGYTYTRVSRALLYTSWEALPRVFLYNHVT